MATVLFINMSTFVDITSPDVKICLLWSTWSLDVEGTFWRSAYVFDCPYFGWLYHDHVSCCTSWMHFRSFLCISFFTITALCPRGRGGVELLCAHPRLWGKVAKRGESVFTASHCLGSPEVPAMAGPVAWQLSRFLTHLLLLMGRERQRDRDICRHASCGQNCEVESLPFVPEPSFLKSFLCPQLKALFTSFQAHRLCYPYNTCF